MSRILIVGAGFAGVWGALAAAREWIYPPAPNRAEALSAANPEATF